MLVAVTMSCFLFVNQVLDGKFFKLGTNWINPPSGLSKNDVLEQVFPLKSRCNVRIGGTGGGDPENHQFMCVLAPNSITRYVFLFMWFWYVFSLVVSTLNLLLNIGMMGHSYKLRALYLVRAVGSRKVQIYFSFQ